MPYGFRKQLCDQIPTIWPDQKVCEERLRQLFRDEDAAGSAVKEATVNSDAEQQESPLDIGETVERKYSVNPVRFFRIFTSLTKGMLFFSKEKSSLCL